MKTKKRLDDNITKLVHSINLSPPPTLESKINTVLNRTNPDSRPRSIFHIRRLKWAAISLAATVLLFIILVVLFLHKSPAPYISEIRTEFELPDKNITGIFIQRSDFDLFEEAKK